MESLLATKKFIIVTKYSSIMFYITETIKVIKLLIVLALNIRPATIVGGTLTYNRQCVVALFSTNEGVLVKRAVNRVGNIVHAVLFQK